MKKILMLFLVCLLITGCTSNETKEVKTINDFTNKGINNNFEVIDTYNDYGNVEYINDAKKIKIDDNTFIEMITYDSNENAEKVLESHIKSFNNLKNTGAGETNLKGKNYHKYVLVSNGYYMVSSRIDNTLIFSKVPLASKNTVETFINDFGY